MRSLIGCFLPSRRSQRTSVRKSGEFPSCVYLAQCPNADTKHLIFRLILRWAGNSPRAYAPTQCSYMDTWRLVSMISGQQSPQSWYMLHTYPNAQTCVSPYSVIPATATPSTLFFLSQNSKHQCIMVPESHNNANLSHNVSHLTFLPVQYCTGWIS